MPLIVPADSPDGPFPSLLEVRGAFADWMRRLVAADPLLSGEVPGIAIVEPGGPGWKGLLDESEGPHRKEESELDSDTLPVEFGRMFNGTPKLIALAAAAIADSLVPTAGDTVVPYTDLSSARRHHVWAEVILTSPRPPGQVTAVMKAGLRVIATRGVPKGQLILVGPGESTYAVSTTTRVERCYSAFDFSVDAVIFGRRGAHREAARIAATSEFIRGLWG